MIIAKYSFMCFCDCVCNFIFLKEDHLCYKSFKIHKIGNGNAFQFFFSPQWNSSSFDVKQCVHAWVHIHSTVVNIVATSVYANWLWFHTVEL